jgi:hypothetical protein
MRPIALGAASIDNALGILYHGFIGNVGIDEGMPLLIRAVLSPNRLFTYWIFSVERHVILLFSQFDEGRA